MKYFVYLNNKDNDSIVKQSFLMSKNLHSMNNSGDHSNFINMFEQYNLTSLDTESLDHDKIRRHTTEMREKYLPFWRHSLENSTKIEFHKTFKDEFSTPDYLYQLRHYDERRKFKVSNHKLLTTTTTTTITATATATATATQGRSYLYARYAHAYLKKSRVKKTDNNKMGYESG